MHSAHRIQKGLYARKNTSAQRLLGLAASHRLLPLLLLACCTAAHRHTHIGGVQ